MLERVWRKRELSYTVAGNVNWCSHFGKQYRGSLKTYDPAISLLGIYTDKTIIQKDICTLMFIAAPFTIAKTWTQSKCPPTNVWIKSMWYINTMEYYSAIKKNEIMPSAAT